MIEFKITADNSEDFLRDLTTAARALTGTAITQLIADPISGILADAAKEAAPAPKPVRGKTKAEAETNEVPGSKTNSVTAQPNTGTVVNEGKATGTAPTAPVADATVKTPATAAAEQPKAETGRTGAVLDFDKDVAPKVLGYVKSHGKPWVVAVLEQFGVERASELAPEQFGELLTALDDKAEA